MDSKTNLMCLLPETDFALMLKGIIFTKNSSIQIKTSSFEIPAGLCA
jgi:hypothetical protein